MNCTCKKCIEKRSKCEWFEVGSYRQLFNGDTESYTIESFDKYDEALQYKSKLMLDNPEIEYFIDGWVNKNNPIDIWNENE